LGDFDKLRKYRCECGAPDCAQELAISWVELDAVDHSRENLSVIAPGHQLRGARSATTIVQNERFSVVRVVEEHDR